MNTKSNATDLYGTALSYALSLACNMEDANDLVQDAFLKYYETKDAGQDTLGFLLQTIKYEWKRVSFDRSQSIGIDQFAFSSQTRKPRAWRIGPRGTERRRASSRIWIKKSEKQFPPSRLRNVGIGL